MFNTIYPNDVSYWELVHELVQQEPPGAGDPKLMGLLASVGIARGKPFEPDDRTRKLLEDAVEVRNATARTDTFAARPEEWSRLLPELGMSSALFVGGYLRDPPPQITADGPVPPAPRATVPAEAGFCSGSLQRPRWRVAAPLRYTNATIRAGSISRAARAG